jgi:hypothetical protein
VKWNAIAVSAVGIAGPAGCGSNRGYQQSVPGGLVRVGGPAPGSPFPLPGDHCRRCHGPDVYGYGESPLS